MFRKKHKHKITHRIILSLIIILLILPTISYAWTGKVVGVSDGDTITVLLEGKGQRIRLYGIDCPEKHQDFGNKAVHLRYGVRKRGPG